MKVSNELKDNLIADVENICNITLSYENLELLKRCLKLQLVMQFLNYKLRKKDTKIRKRMDLFSVVNLENLNNISLI